MLKPNPRRFFRFTCNGKYSHGDLDRYSSKVDTTPGLGPRGDCWEWSGGLRCKYGQFSIRKNGRYITYFAHRMAYETATNRIIPDGQCVLHHCDNPKCVKVFIHLFLGTHQDNMTDKSEKQRQSIGENHGMAKFTWTQVIEIRKLYNTGEYTMQQLANRFNVHQTSIADIITNKIWYDNNYTRINFKKGNSLLCIEDAKAIRIKYSTRRYTQKQLANEFNTSQVNISNIINNKIWIDV